MLLFFCNTCPAVPPAGTLCTLTVAQSYVPTPGPPTVLTIKNCPTFPLGSGQSLKSASCGRRALNNDVPASYPVSHSFATGTNVFGSNAGSIRFGQLSNLNPAQSRSL